MLGRVEACDAKMADVEYLPMRYRGTRARVDVHIVTWTRGWIL